MSLPSVFDVFCKIATDDPERLFVEVRKRGAKNRLTYGELHGLSLRFAASYTAQGLGQGSTVAILVPHGVEQYACYLGAMAIGAVPSFFTPFNVKSKPELFWSAQSALFDLVAPSLVVTNADGAALITENLPNLGPPVWAVEAVHSEPLPATQTAVHPTALIQYSSGTTGPRKGVSLTHAAILLQTDAYRCALGLQAEDRIASWLPLYHDMGLITSFIMPLLNGASVVALDPFEWVSQPTSLLDAIEEFEATRCWLPNFAFAHLANAVRPGAAWDLSHVRTFVNCSEPCRGATFRRFLEVFGPMGVAPEALQVCYAAAETVFAITQTFIGMAVPTLSTLGPCDQGQDVLSSGRPVNGVELRFVDEDGRDVEDGAFGEVWIRSPFTTDRYFGSDRSAVDADGWYASRDLGVLKQGELFVLGRIDDVIVTRGKNIFAHEVEQFLSTMPGLKAGRNAALGLFSETAGTTELALVLEAAITGPDRVALRRQVSQGVEATFGIAPSIIQFVPDAWLVKTSSGKISRSRNVERLRDLLATTPS